MELVSMEVDVEAQVFSGLQDGARGAEVKHSLFTEHVDVVHAHSPCRHELSEPRQLHVQDVVRGLCDRLPPGDTTQVTCQVA